MKKKIKGFNLVELMISMTIMSTLMVLTTPYYLAWLANMRIKSIAENINLGIIQARAEAIKRNQFVYFSINNDTSWQIYNQNNQVINQKSSGEGGKGISLQIIPNGADTITFNGVGSVSNNIDNSNTLNAVIVTSPNIENTQILTVKIGDGGGSLVCYSTADCVNKNVN